MRRVEFTGTVECRWNQSKVEGNESRWDGSRSSTRNALSPALKSVPLYTQAPRRSHEVITMPRGRPVKCIHCGSTDTTSKGSRRTKTMGIRKIRRCKACGRRFTPRNQRLVPYEGAEAPQGETAESFEPEPTDTTHAATSEAVEPDRAEPCDTDTQTPTSIESEAPNDEHQSPGL